MHIHILLHLTPAAEGMCNLTGAILEIAVHYPSCGPRLVDRAKGYLLDSSLCDSVGRL